MKNERRDFLKKTGLLGIGGFISPFSVFSENQHKRFQFQQNSYLIKNACVLSMDEEIGDFKSADVIIENGKTPTPDDGIIYISNVEDAFQIKTGKSIKQAWK